MRLILKDYIETLKEEKELEGLLEKILIMDNFKKIIRPQKGVTQHGVDFYAEKNDNIFLFVLKQKDIDKANWNAGNNAVRPTLDEIQDVYIPEKIKNQNAKINIIVCTNGIIKQNVDGDWKGYIERNSNDNVGYSFWGIDELAEKTERLLMNEYLFEDDMRSDLRRSLYFYNEDVNMNYFKKLMDKIVQKIDVSNKNKKSYRKGLIVYILVSKMCISYASEKNKKVAEKMSEKALLIFWSFIMRNSLYEKSQETEILIELFKQYEDACENYLNDIKRVYKYSPSFPIYNPLEYRILVYEVIGFIASYTYFLYYYYGENQKVMDNVNILLTIINNNAGFYYPVYDLNSIEINTLFFLLKEVGNNQIETITNNIIIKMLRRMCSSKYYPVEYENYDKALQIEFNEDVEEFKASVLITNIFEWMTVFNKTEDINMIADIFYKKFPDISLNTLEIDKDSEQFFFDGKIHDSFVTYEIDFNESIDKAKAKIDIIKQKSNINEYLCSKYSSLPFLFIAARNYRIPIPSCVIYKFL